MSFNEKLSYTEHVVTTPTTDFSIGFKDYGDNSDTIKVTVNDVLATEAGYTVFRKNAMTIALEPAVTSGVVRLQRETNIDSSFYKFTAGAKFVAANMDENFEQLRHSQQEVRDGFSKLADDTYEIIDTLQVVGQSAQAAADAAEQAAELANDAAAQVSDKVPKSATLPTYLTISAGIDPVTGVADGAYFNVRSSSDASYIDEYQNLGGVAVATGKSCPSSVLVGKLSAAMMQAKLDRLNIRDFGAILDGTEHKLSEQFSTLAMANAVYPFATSLNDTLDFCAYQSAINYAMTKGFNTRPTINDRTGRGGIVYAPSGQAVINRSLIMPRSGNFDGASVYIEGESTSSSAIAATSTFPAGRAMIEWEDSAQRVYWQGISNIAFRLPNILDTKAVWFRKSSACIAGGSTSALIFAEYLHGMTMRNVTVEATNTHHKNAIQFDGYVRVSKFDTLTSNVGLGDNATYNTVFLQFASDYGTSATVLGESNGCAYSEINNIWGMGQRGGSGVLVKGRFLQSTGRNWTNGNGTLDVTPAFEINNSFIFSLENTGSEGRGEQPQYLINNCFGVNLKNIGLGAPDVDGCVGIKFQKCESCTLVGRYAPIGSPSFSSRGGKAVIIDADCVNVKVSEFYITSTYLNELQILAPASANNSVSWVLASNKTQGTYLAGDRKYTKDIVLATRRVAQAIPFGGAFTTIVWQNVQLDTNSKFNSATGEYVSGKITTVRLSGGFTILNAVLGQVYEVNLSANGTKTDRLAMFTADANGAVFVPFSKIVQISGTTLRLGVGISNPSTTTDITISQYGVQNNISIEEIV
jgi:hypothetical protein